MIKHTDQFQLAVVQEYLGGSDGYTVVARRHGIAASMVRRWTTRFQLHGLEGLRRKVTRYSAEFKLGVLRYMWDNSVSHARAAAVHNIRNTTSVCLWEQRYLDGGVQALAYTPATSLKTMTIPTSKPPPAEEDDKAKLKRALEENQFLRMENAILKKFDALAQKRNAANAPKKRK